MLRRSRFYDSTTCSALALWQGPDTTMPHAAVILIRALLLLTVMSSSSVVITIILFDASISPQTVYYSSYSIHETMSHVLENRRCDPRSLLSTRLEPTYHIVSVPASIAAVLLKTHHPFREPMHRSSGKRVCGMVCQLSRTVGGWWFLPSR